jgi:hypothetical protein
MKPYLIILYLISAVVLGAAGDALMLESGLKVWAHIFTAVETLLLISGIALFKIQLRQLFLWIVIYTSLRIGIFDYIWNWVAGEDLLYVGSTSLWDKVVQMVLPMGMIFIRLLFTCLGIGLILRYFKD